MAVTQQKIDVNSLQVGMFVSDLDRAWCETPFPLQGFYIRSVSEIDALRSYCKHVFVDIPEKQGELESLKGSVDVFARRRLAKHVKTLKLPPVVVRNPRRYTQSAPLKREVSNAVKLHRQMRDAVEQVKKQLEDGQAPRLADTEKIALGMVDSVIRNPDALVWLSRVQSKDDYTFRHSINASVWALVFGRFLGLEREVLTTLAMGTLLSHIGKTQLPIELLQKESALDAEEFKIFKTYVDRGAALLEESGMSHQVVAIVRHHRERHNGTGFPQGVTGDRIPLLAKISGLVDCYESLIEPREGATPMSPAQAVSYLYEQRNIEFQEDLVERFIQAVGVFPTGTLVELTNGELGVVMSHEPNRRLWPKVMVVSDKAHQPLKEARIVDLAAINERGGEPLLVRACLPAGSYGIDPSKYLVTGAAASSSWSLKNLFGCSGIRPASCDQVGGAILPVTP